MFKIPIQVQGIEKRRRSIGVLHALAGFFLMSNASSAYKILNLSAIWPLVPTYIAAFLSLAYALFRKKLDPTSRFNLALRLFQGVTFLVLGFAYLNVGAGVKSVGLLLWVFISLMLAFTEKVALQVQEVQVDETGISFPNGLYRKKQTWKELSDINVRPDFLTVHYPDNRFLQFELAEGLSETENQKLQDFCRRHLVQTVAAG